MGGVTPLVLMPNTFHVVSVSETESSRRFHKGEFLQFLDRINYNRSTHSDIIIYSRKHKSETSIRHVGKLKLIKKSLGEVGKVNSQSLLVVL